MPQFSDACFVTQILLDGAKDLIDFPTASQSTNSHADSDNLLWFVHHDVVFISIIRWYNTFLLIEVSFLLPQKILTLSLGNHPE